MGGHPLSHPFERIRKSAPLRRLRVTRDPGDLTEIAFERVTERGMPMTSPENRVILLDDADLVWLVGVLSEASMQIGEETEAVPSSKTSLRLVEPVTLSAYGPSTLSEGVKEVEERGRRRHAALHVLARETRMADKKDAP